MLNKKTVSRILLSCILIFLTAESALFAEEKSSAQTILNVRDFSGNESFTGGIQEAIRYLSRTGEMLGGLPGTVSLPRSRTMC